MNCSLLNIPYITILGISLLLIAGLAIFLIKRMNNQNHKFSSIVGVVTSMADELCRLKTLVTGGIVSSCIKVNTTHDTHVSGPSLVTVSDESEDEPESIDDSDSDDEDSDDNDAQEDADDDDDEDDDEDDDDDDDDEDDKIQSTQSDIIISSLNEETNIVSSALDEVMVFPVDIMLSINDESLIPIEQNTNTNTIPNEDLSDNLDLTQLQEDTTIDLSTDNLETDIVETEQLEIIQNTFTEDEKPSSITSINIQSSTSSSSSSGKINYKKLSLDKLRNIVTERGVIIPEISKLKKAELVKILEA